MTTYQQQNFTTDDNVVLKASGAIAASAAVATVIDLGDAYMEGNIVIDISNLDDIDGNNEIYDIVLQLTNTAAFATDTDIVDRCSMTFCAKEVTRTDCNADSLAGRYIMPFDNCYKETIYRYARLYTIVAGAGVGAGITYSARMAKRLG